MTDPISPLVSAAVLASRLGDPALRIIDASWRLDGRDTWPDFEAERIPGAIFFDLEASSEQDGDLPHMLPSPGAFAARMGSLGVAETDLIVVYDTEGIRSAPRAWWMLKAMGASNVQVLDGGLPAWRAAHQPVESGAPSPGAATVFKAEVDAGFIADFEGVRRALSAGDQVVDARAAARFRGQAQEPRPGLRSGHMPGALNLPFSEVLNADGGLREVADLRDVFRNAGVDLSRPVITSCGSGVTAAILSLALARLGVVSSLYDGSWAEWGARADAPVEIG